MENKVDVTISDATVAQFITKLDELKALVPFLISLSPKERKSKQRMGRGRVAFVTNALEGAKLNDAIKPKYGNIANAEKDLVACAQLDKIVYPLLEFTQMITDTRVQAGSEAYNVALKIYNEAAEAVKEKVPGVEVIYNQLKQQFEQSDNTSDELENTAK